MTLKAVQYCVIMFGLTANESPTHVVHGRIACRRLTSPPGRAKPMNNSYGVDPLPTPKGATSSVSRLTFSKGPFQTHRFLPHAVLSSTQWQCVPVYMNKHTYGRTRVSVIPSLYLFIRVISSALASSATRQRCKEKQGSASTH